MKKPGIGVGLCLLGALALGQGGKGFAASDDVMAVSPVLNELLSFHPAWVTRSVTSHDPWGGNGDGSGDGIAREGEYHVLFHGKGEGRITRIWMTDNYDDAVAHDWKELWIQIDGQTVYRGNPIDFFSGRGPWKAPLVLDFNASSGGFLSYVPFPYAREAKVMMLGEPHYFHVTYRQGAGSSAGPTAEELSRFMSENWAQSLSERAPERVAHAEAVAPARLAEGPSLVSGVELTLSSPEDLKRLRVRVGREEPVPASFFFGLGATGTETADGGWAAITSSIHHVDPALHRLSARLPIPLRTGESFAIETVDGSRADFRYRLAHAPGVVPGVRLAAQFREQMGPGIETTMPFFENHLPTQFVSLVEEITDGKPGERNYLEGDEMIRTDQMLYPLQLGTGTEDYFNGGWYFLGAHSNPMSGQPRFVVLDPGEDWSHARFEHSLYRNHIADPVVGRDGIRFGFEAGDTGAYHPVRYRTLGLAYVFDGLIQYARAQIAPAEIRGEGMAGRLAVGSAVDAERNQQPFRFESRVSRGRSVLSLSCKSRQEPVGVFLARGYDAMAGGQEASVRVNGRDAGMLYEAYANPNRRYAQDGIWLDLLPTDCASGAVTIELDSSHSHALWSEAGYQATFYTLGMSAGLSALGRAPAVLESPIVQGERTLVLDSTRLDGSPHYVNDHAIVESESGNWHLYGIYHAEPADPENEIQFIHATHRGPLSLPSNAQFEKSGIALEYEPGLGETHIWAPHVARDGHRYLMVFQSGGKEADHSRISLAESSDLSHWRRVGNQPLFDDICVARDPMLRKMGSLWTIYYTRCNDAVSRRSGVAYRNSADLIHWSEPRMALVLADTPPMFNSGYTESPFVFEKGGWYYLSVTSYPVDYEATFVYRSRSPFSFPSQPFARLQAHAAEWLRDSQGNLLMTSAGWGKEGVWMMPVSGI